MIASFCSTAWRACDVLQESHNLTTRVSSTGPFASAGWDQFVGGTWDAWGCLMGTPKSTPNPSKSHGLSHGLSGNIRLVFFVTSQFTKAKSEPWLCCTRWHKMRPLSIPDVKWSFCTGTVEVCSFCWCSHNWYPVHLSNYRSSSVPSSTMFDYSNVLGLFMAFPHKQFRTCKKNLLSFPLLPLPLCVSGLQAAACIGSSEQLHCLESSPSILFGSLSSCWSMLYINVYYA